MGNSPPSGTNGKRHYSGDPYSCSFNEGLYVGSEFPGKRRSTSNRRMFSFGKGSSDMSSCIDPMDHDINDVNQMFRRTSIRDIFKSSNKHNRERSNSVNCNMIFQMEPEQDKSIDDQTHLDRMSIGEPENANLVPTVFRWKGGGNEIFISGTFNQWENKIPLVRNKSDACIIINVPPGEHEYKFFIDGAWYHDPTKPFKENQFNTKNNVILVKSEDSNVITALDEDIANSKHVQDETSPSTNMLGSSPPGEYGQIIPANPELQNLDMSIPGCYNSSCSPTRIVRPPVLPPLLAQGLLNRDIDPTCDPNLLPSPIHVIVNHLYALSIKNGVIVLSVIHRYRQKYVSTLFYKPIKG